MLVLSIVTSIGAVSCGGKDGSSSTKAIVPSFLDVLAPTSGDDAARGREQSQLALARAAADSVAECMADAGFGQYKSIGMLEAADQLSNNSYFTSPTKLERRGFVSVADRRLDKIPAEAKTAWMACSGEDDDVKPAAENVWAFIVFRDSDANPFANWHQGVVGVKMKAIAESDDAKYDDYRECFRQLGVTADDARNPADAIQFGLDAQNKAGLGRTITEDMEARWRDGKGVLDPDGGASAKSFARCWRQFEAHLSPMLESERDEMIDEHREAIVEGQELLYEAIGGEGAMTRESTSW